MRKFLSLFLSLLLAMCMVFSLCMTGASAVYDDINNDEDISDSGVFNIRVPDAFDIYMDKGSPEKARCDIA